MIAFCTCIDALFRLFGFQALKDFKSFKIEGVELYHMGQAAELGE